jgi:putative transposase
MAESVLDASWAGFRRMLSYKAMTCGGMCLKVNEAYTSQVCSCCGVVPEGRPKGIAGLGIRGWTCDACTTMHHRDVNAARNIRRLGLETLAEGAMSEDAGKLAHSGRGAVIAAHRVP